MQVNKFDKDKDGKLNLHEFEGMVTFLLNEKSKAQRYILLRNAQREQEENENKKAKYEKENKKN